MSRGDRQAAIFLDDEDRRRFLKTLGEACEKAGWQVHAYCLIENHFHLAVETPQPTLVAGMKWFGGIYTQRFTVRHRMRGHLFAGRYKSLLVDGAEDMSLRVVCDYVHLNPAGGGRFSGFGWKDGGLCVGQFSALSQADSQAAWLVAGGSSAGGVGNPEGQSGRKAGVW